MPQLENPMGMHIVIVGNPIDGFSAVGPFKVPSAAVDWATSNVSQEWWPMQLEAPEGFNDGEG